MDLIPLNLFMKLLFRLVSFQILCGGLWMQHAKYNNYYYYRYSNRVLMKQRWLQATISLTEQML